MEMPAISIKNINKTYIDQDGNEVQALHDINLDVAEGEFVCIVGPSGCGKSTLGRTLIRLQQPTDGHIYLNGTDIAGLKGAQLKEMRKEAQIIFQDPSACLNPRRTIKQILMEPFEIHNLKGKIDVDAKIMELLQLVGLDSYHLSRYPHELSGGQLQRVAIARALAIHPELLICDEATGALDVSIQAQILNLLMDLQEEKGLSYMFITHDLSVVKYISDRVGVMYLGTMVELAAADEIFHHPIHPYTEALLNAIPTTDTVGAKELSILEGDIPSPVNPPKGCKFHTRCKYCTEICTQVVPEWEEVRPNHFVACHHKLEAKE